MTMSELSVETPTVAAVDGIEIIPDPPGLTEPEIQRRHRRVRADQRLARLSKLSVKGGTDAFADLPWDEPGMAITATDARLRLPEFDPLASTDWYRNLSIEEQTRVGALRWATGLTRGWRFENIMQQSLLLRGLYLDSDPAEFRYSYHELIEESQHTLMFREVVDRLGLPVPRPPWWTGPASFFNRVLARGWTPAFFVLVLGGEEPVDRYQRRSIAEGIEHPLLDKIIRVHVAEEARHTSFARVTLERDVAGQGWIRRQLLGIHSAFSLYVMVRLMLVPPTFMARQLGVPKSTLTDPFKTPDGRAFLADAITKPRNLLSDLGVLRGPAKWLWRALGLGEP